MLRKADLLVIAIQKDSAGRVKKMQVGIDVINRVIGKIELNKEEVISI